MDRAKKMVLISTENLERMQQQLQRHPPSPAWESKETTAPRNSENTENANSSAQTPGTPLSRLDAEMSRILNSAWPRGGEDERWKMYREVLWRYLHFFREVRRRNGAERPEDDNDDNDTRGDADTVASDGTTLDAVFRDLSRETRTPVTPRHSSSIGNIVGNVGSEKEHIHMMKKSVAGIVESVPKSYRGQARLLMRYLFDKAVPARIRWDEHGVVIIDGNVVEDSNIEDLINDAMRQRKTVKATGRSQFAQLLRKLNTPFMLVGNKELFATKPDSPNIGKPQPPASSTPNSPTATKRTTVEKRRNREQEEKEEEEEAEEESSTASMKNVDSPPPRERYLSDWIKPK